MVIKNSPDYLRDWLKSGATVHLVNGVTADGSLLCVLPSFPEWPLDFDIPTAIDQWSRRLTAFVRAWDCHDISAGFNALVFLMKFVKHPSDFYDLSGNAPGVLIAVKDFKINIRKKPDEPPRKYALQYQIKTSEEYCRLTKYPRDMIADLFGSLARDNKVPLYKGENVFAAIQKYQWTPGIIYVASSYLSLSTDFPDNPVWSKVFRTKQDLGRALFIAAKSGSFSKSTLDYWVDGIVGGPKTKRYFQHDEAGYRYDLTINQDLINDDKYGLGRVKRLAGIIQG